MNDLLLVAAENTVVAMALALCVYGFTRVVRNPPLAHALWLLVLVKLMSPPLVRVDWSLPSVPKTAFEDEQTMAEAPTAQSEAGYDSLRPAAEPANSRSLAETKESFVEQVTVDAAVRQSTKHEVKKPLAATILPSVRAHTVPLLFFCWVGGGVFYALVAAVRVVRFHLAVREMLPASGALDRLVRETAGKLGVRRTPDVRCAESVESPLFWCVLRPTIVLPLRLLRHFDEQQVRMILAHELAHLRRRDHWVRAIELIVAVVYWWNPLVWFIRRQVHQSEELCCDAWVRWAFADGRKCYAEAVLKAAECLSASRTGDSVLVKWWDSKETVAPAEFPHAVKFEQGATKFLDGDSITIVEVRGTAETFQPGQIYWIKGTYTLASHDSASLAAYTTAKNAADARSKSFSAQTTTVKKGSGNFTLFLPMACEGWPHVSFYPAKGGESFGGNYFGTGDSVLKHWWGPNETDAPAKDDKAAKQTQSSRGARRAFGASQKPIREKIFRQLDIEEGRYEVPVKVPPDLVNDSRVSLTFVTIQPDHDAWVKAFFREGKGTTYKGIWTSDGDVLPAIPIAHRIP
jgi:beta-lactamase regulating signal transducer with metallopeptidase domain